MDNMQYHTVMMRQVKVLYCIVIALGLLAIAGLDLYAKQYRFAAVAASFALGLVVYAGYLLLNRRQVVSVYLEYALVGLLLLFTLLGMSRSAQVVHWTYLIPIFAYAIFPFRFASIALAIYSAILIILILHTFPHEHRIQVIFTYACCYMFSLMYALMNERNQSRLAGSVTTNPQSLVYNEQQLAIDLNKEIRRADRQCTDLLLVVVGIPGAWKHLNEESYNQRLVQLNDVLMRALNKYDACYHVNNEAFVLLMPQRPEKETLVLVQRIQQILLNESFYFAKLLVFPVQYQSDDDVKSVLERIRSGLHAG